MEGPVRTSRNTAGIALAAALICLLVYLRALSCGFVNWEDQEYVLNNTAIRSLDRNFFVWAFTTLPLGFWLPLTWLSFAVDYHFWGLNPTGYHLTNVLLHAAGTGLVVLTTNEIYRSRLTIDGAASWHRYLYPGMLLFSGLLFGLHPSKVESVVWVTERKDVLNGVFAIGSALFYLRYVNQSEAAPAKGAGLRYYILSLVLLLLSLMAKPSSVVLPVVFLVLDWYPLGRFRKGRLLPVLVEKLPYLALSAAITAVNVIGHAQQDVFNAFGGFPLGQRAIASGNALFEYFRLMIYPVGILPYYDLPWPMPVSFIVKAAALLCLLLSCIWWRKKRPWLTAMIVSFVIAMAPMLHFFAAGLQLIIASRYTYLPSLAPGIILAAVLAGGYQAMSRAAHGFRAVVYTVLIGSLLVFYGVMTQRLIGVWKDSGAMWSRVIAYQPFDRAYFYRGLFYVDTGNYTAAVEDYTTCLNISIKDSMPAAYIYNLYAFRGEALTKAGRFEEAVEDFNVAISMFPHRLYYYHRGMALEGLGRGEEAREDFDKAGGARGQMFWFPPGSAL